MKKIMLSLLKHFVLLYTGGLAYVLIELLWRGYSHWTMFFVGGLCFVLIGLINELIPWEMKLRYQMLIGAIIVTVVEFISGCIINLWLGWNVWNYSNLPLNILGQVCLLFSVLWYLLSAVAIVIDDCLRYVLFYEEKPHYKW